jgi:PAS domain S-box-containing protein
MKTENSNSFGQKFIDRVYESTHKWESDLWILKWIALLFIIIDFHLINSTPISKIEIISTEFLYFIYALLVTILLRKKLSFNVQISNLMVDFLFFTFFQYLSLSMFADTSKLFVLYIIPVIYCSYWFRGFFSLIFVTLVATAYFILNYSIILANLENFFIISELKGTLAPVVALYFIVTFMVFFFKRRILKYLVDIDQYLERRAEKLKQEKENTRGLLKDKIDGFIVIDEDGYVTDINNLGCELFGYDQKEIYDKNVKEIYAPADASRMIRALRKSPDGTIENFRTSVINKKEMKTIPFLVSAAFLYDRSLNLKEELAKGRKFPSLGYFRDIRAEDIYDNINKEITSKTNEKELLDKIVEIVAKTIKSETCSIFVYNENRGVLELMSTHGIPKEYLRKKKEEIYEENESMTGRVFSSGKTLNIPDIDIANRKPQGFGIKWEYMKQFARLSRYKDLKFFLGTPLRIQGEVYGVIRVLNKYHNESKLDKQGFTHKDEWLLERISNQVSILLEKVRNNERFGALSKVGMELNAKVDVELEDLLKFIAKEVVHGMRYKACFLRLLENGNKLRLKACYGVEGKYLEKEQYTIKLGDGISGKIAQNGMIKTVEDIKKEKKFKFKDILKNEYLGSMLCIPLKYRGRAIGVISCYTRRIHKFTDQEIQIMETFANYAAVAIQNKKRVQELLAVNEIGKELVKPFRIEELMDLILEKAKEISGADRICIKSYDERTGDIVTLSAWGCEWYRQTKNYVFKLGCDLISEVIKTGEPKNIPDYHFQLEKINNVPNKDLFADTKSCMIVPIKIYDRVFGVLRLESKSENSFNGNDLLILRTFSNQVAAAIRNADFFNKLQDVKETFPRISELNMDIHEVLEKIVDTAADVLETDALVLYRYDEKTKKIILPPIYTGDIKYKEFIESEAIPSGTPISIINSGISHYADCSREDPVMTAKGRALPEGIPGRFVIRENIVYSAGIILKVGKDIVGVMFINYRTAHEFNADERQLIEIFASYIAIAIQNVMHFSEKKTADMMNTIGQIASNFAHKVKNDIATIKLYTDGLIDGVKPNELQYFPLSQIMEKIAKIRADIDHLEKASKLIVKRKKIDLKKLIDELEAELLPDLEIRKTEFHIEILTDIPEIEIDPTQIKMVLINLAQNSLDAMPEGGKISLSISKSGEVILLKWTDSGCGISPEDAHKIFDALWTKKKKGYGLGLFHAKAIIEEHRGSISVDIKYKGGARFLIEIPIK